MANENAKAVGALFDGAADFETRRVTAGGVPVTVYFIDGLTSGGDIADFVLRPLAGLLPGTQEEIFERAASGAVWCAAMTRRTRCMSPGCRR